MTGIQYHSFNANSQAEFGRVLELIAVHLLEPYSIYVYWYFLNTWPQYCWVAREENTPDEIVGVIISKVEPHREVRMRGYIGMLVIAPAFRGRGIASALVKLTVEKMVEWDNVDEVLLETEVDNAGALHLYELVGFMRTKRLFRYYINANDAFRLILPISEKSTRRVAFLPTITA